MPDITRQLGKTAIRISSIGLGCWPMAGVSSLGVADADSIRTIQAAVDAGINFFDTAYSYGYSGESDALLARALSGRTDQVVLATKVGTHYDSSRQRIIDGRPELLLQQAKESLRRLKVEQFAVIYLHTPDPQVPLAESAGAIADMVSLGYTQHAGVSNVTLAELKLFHSHCGVAVVQPCFNMLQQEIAAELGEFCSGEKISIACYWVLMKGLLAGKMQRNHQFDPNDRRLTYSVYQGQAWQRAQDLLDHLRTLATELDCTVSQLVIAWTLHQTGITCALVGAKRPEQILETARAMEVELSSDTIAEIDGWIAQISLRGL